MKKRMICPKCNGRGIICIVEPVLIDYHKGIYLDPEYGDCPVCEGHKIVDKITKVTYKPVK